MDWMPIGEGELTSLIADAVATMEQPARSLWSLLRVRPARWQQSPWGDEGGGFWVVGVLGERAIWFNDIEWGFNISRYQTYGVIAEYVCNQDELRHTMDSLSWEFENGEPPGPDARPPRR